MSFDNLFKNKVTFKLFVNKLYVYIYIYNFILFFN